VGVALKKILPQSSTSPSPAKPASSINPGFTILIDSNEAQPNHHHYQFHGITSNADTNYLPFDVTTEVRHLGGLGDYSLFLGNCLDIGPWEQPVVAVERKSKADLFGSITDRENMEWRLDRLSNECEFAVIIVESEFSDMMCNPPAFTNQTFKVVHATIQSWQQRFQRVQWLFYPDRETAELGCFWSLFRFYENIRRHKLDRDRKKANYKAYLEGLRAHRKKELITAAPYKKEHAIGGSYDYWVRGWLDHERITHGKDIDISEMPLIPEEMVKFQAPYKG
jgi:hypothetical protein